MNRERQSVVTESYIVRIYRRDDDNPESMVGLVEAVGTEGAMKFGSGGELLKLISRKPGTRRPTKKGMEVQNETT
ncbi:MAG: hypothetical protein C0402_08480 [Thermodesulfovibrio sp.]|nr:hypothetical protein [Thermodesulfovibrio sp.]